MSEAGKATDRSILENELMNPCLPKSELVHYAARRVSELESELTTMRQRLEWREDGHDGIYCRDETIWLLQQDLYSRKNARGKTHCENCGCTWLDDGLNPIGCPYCKDQWQDISTAPKDGTVFEGRVIDIRPYRWTAYKPQAKRQLQKDGRWQRLSEYGGWENCELPTDWVPLPQLPKEQTK